MLKGRVSQDFRLLVFFMNQFSTSSWVYHEGRFKFFRKFAEIFAAQGAPPVSLTLTLTLTPVAYGKIIKVLIILFGHLWEVELTYRYIFAFKFTLRSQQPDIVHIICRRCRWHQWQITTGIKNISETGGKICCQCQWYQWCTLTCEYLSKKFETVQIGILGGWRKTDSWKNQKQKSRETVPLKWPLQAEGCHTLPDNPAELLPECRRALKAVKAVWGLIYRLILDLCFFKKSSMSPQDTGRRLWRNQGS